MKRDNTIEAFFALLRAGLWDQDCYLSHFDEVNYEAILKLAEGQSVVGLVTAGMEHVVDIKVPQEILLQFVGYTLQIEQENKCLNDALVRVMTLLKEEGINAVLVKGQGIALCYERPLWRSSGDIDLLLDETNYYKAKVFLGKTMVVSENENPYRLHLAYSMPGAIVELHGTLRVGLSKKWDSELDRIQGLTFANKDVRVWINGNTEVLLPSPNSDVVFVFAHIIQHLFKGGIGLRQICDWCRLIWTYSQSIDCDLILERVQNLGLMTEWKVLSRMASDYLGMPLEITPEKERSNYGKQRARRLMKFIQKTGNFGHRRDLTYYQRYTYLVIKGISFTRRVSDFFSLLTIFPRDTICFFAKTFSNGIIAVFQGR